MVPEFEKVAFTLPVNEISQPVKTEFGYHIIQVLKKETPALDQVKEVIADQIRQDKFEQMYDDMKKRADPKFDEDFFPAPPPAKPADK